jgi:hypothetical protein
MARSAFLVEFQRETIRRSTVALACTAFVFALALCTEILLLRALPSSVLLLPAVCIIVTALLLVLLVEAQFLLCYLLYSLLLSTTRTTGGQNHSGHARARTIARHEGFGTRARVLYVGKVLVFFRDARTLLANALPAARLELWRRTPPAADECCAVCWGAPRAVAFVPCGHRCFCMACATRVLRSRPTRCPCCNAPTTQAIRIYL